MAHHKVKCRRVLLFPRVAAADSYVRYGAWWFCTQAAQAAARDPVLNSQMKHVARRHFYVREMEEAGEVSVARVDTKWNLADALTKALGRDRLRMLTAAFRSARVLGGRGLAALRAAVMDGWSGHT